MTEGGRVQALFYGAADGRGRARGLPVTVFKEIGRANEDHRFAVYNGRKAVCKNIHRGKDGMDE